MANFEKPSTFHETSNEASSIGLFLLLLSVGIIFDLFKAYICSRRAVSILRRGPFDWQIHVVLR